jgi:hypothetical protein
MQTVDKSLAEAAAKQVKIDNARKVLAAIPSTMNQSFGDTLDANQLLSGAIAGKSYTFRGARKTQDISPQDLMALLTPGYEQVGTPTPGNIQAIDFKDLGVSKGSSASTAGNVAAADFSEPAAVSTTEPAQVYDRPEQGDVRSERDWDQEAADSQYTSAQQEQEDRDSAQARMGWGEETTEGADQGWGDTDSERAGDTGE